MFNIILFFFFEDFSLQPLHKLIMPLCFMSSRLSSKPMLILFAFCTVLLFASVAVQLHSCTNLYILFDLLQIVEVLTESLTLKETPIPTKVARLMLVSDILHNSSAPVKNSSAYRTKFEATLPDIMESFNDLHRSITGRITAEALKVT